MPRRSFRSISSKDVQGLKYLKVLQPLLQHLHDVGTERDKAGNRQLHMDEYCVLVLLWLFSPLLTSLRAVQRASQLEKIQRRFRIPRAALGSLSESVRVFDPEPLKNIAQELAARVPRNAGSAIPASLGSYEKTLTAVDGSVVRTLARIAELAWITGKGDKPTCGYRLHTQFEVVRGLPSRIDVTPANPKGEDDERAVLQRTLAGDRMYVMDRGYQKWALWNAIVAVGSSYLCRVRDSINCEVIEDKQLSDDDIAAGVLSDALVRIPSSKIDHPVRMVCVRCTPHTSRGRRCGRKYSSTAPSSDGVMRLITNELALPAELIGEMYRLRWLIEIYFRMFKQLLGCRHLLSTKQAGVEIQVYCAIIACLLIQLHTGCRLTKATFEMVCFYVSGWATLDELEAHIQSLKPAA